MDTTPEPEQAHGEDEADGRSLFVRARRHPIATATLGASMLLGSVICVVFLPESLSLPRRAVGGLLVGGLSWLLVMMGRVLD